MAKCQINIQTNKGALNDAIINLWDTYEPIPTSMLHAGTQSLNFAAFPDLKNLAQFSPIFQENFPFKPFKI